MDIKVKAFSEYEKYKKERIGKPFKSMGDADWFVAGFLAASSTSSNSDYAKCQELLKECFDVIGTSELCKKPIYEKLMRHFA